MGIFTYRPSIVEPLDDGRLRFTPEPPDPRWMRWLEGAMTPLIVVLLAVSWATGDADPGIWLILSTAFAVLLVVSLAFTKISRRRSGEVRVAPPTEPVTIDAQLTSELRELAARDEEGEAIKLVCKRLGVGFADGARIVKAAQRA